MQCVENHAIFFYSLGTTAEVPLRNGAERVLNQHLRSVSATCVDHRQHSRSSHPAAHVFLHLLLQARARHRRSEQQKQKPCMLAVLCCLRMEPELVIGTVLLLHLSKIRILSVSSL